MTQRVLRWPIEVDDDVHFIGAGPVTGARADSHTQISLWTLEPTQSSRQRKVIVVGTGHPIADGFVVIASVWTGTFAWHVITTKEQA